MMMSRQLYSRTTRDAKSLLFPSSSSLDTNNNNNNNREGFCFFLCRRETPLSLSFIKKLLWSQDSWGVEGILKRKRRLGFRVFRDEEKTSLFLQAFKGKIRPEEDRQRRVPPVVVDARKRIRYTYMENKEEEEEEEEEEERVVPSLFLFGMSSVQLRMTTACIYYKRIY